MADLHDLLGSLVAGPDPVLAPASDVRARGEQRRRRTHAVVAAATALVVAVGAGTAVALAERGKPDALVPLTPPTPTATPAVPAAYLLTPEDASRVAGGTWDPGITVSDQGLLLYVCPAGEGYDEPGVTRVMESAGRGMSNVVSVLDPGQPQRWVDTFRKAAIDCPRRAADSEDGKASNTFEVLSGASRPETVMIRDTYRDCDTCRASVTLWLVVASDRVLSVVSLASSELDRLEAWRSAVQARLADPVPNPPTPTPTPSPSYEPVVPDTELSEDDLVELDRIGPIMVGMTLEEARAAAGQELRQEGDDLGGCVYYAPRSGEPDVSFMVIRGVVSRIDVDSGTTSTNSGIRIGSTEAEVKQVHPQAVVSKHYYTDGHYLRVLSEDGRYAFLFETDGTKVVNFRSGFPDAVDQVEGCA